MGRSLAFICVFVLLGVFVQAQVSSYKKFRHNDHEFLTNPKKKLSLCELHKAITVIPFQWTGSNLKAGDHEPLYVPMSKKTARHHYYKLVTGETRPLKALTDLDFCLYNFPFWDSQDPSATYVVYNKYASEVRCRPGGDHAGYLSCVAENGVSFKTFMTMSDEKTFMVWVHCWDDGETTWVVYSKNAKLAPEVKWDILYHVRSLGFQPKDRRETDYESHCPRRGRDLEDIVDTLTYPARAGEVFEKRFS